MRRILHIIVLVALVGGTSEVSHARIRRGANESVERFAARLLPPRATAAFAPVAGRIGPYADGVVVLFRSAADADSNFTGWVLVPTHRSRTYRKLILPPMQEIGGVFRITVEDVFFVDADRDGNPELAVLYSYDRGGGAPGRAVYLYKATKRGFITLDDLERRLIDLDSAEKVRAKLQGPR